MTNNRFLDALLKLILVSAIVHLGVLGFQFFRTGDVSIINYFNILDLDFIFPDIASGSASQIASVLVVAGLYLALLLFFTKKRRS